MPLAPLDHYRPLLRAVAARMKLEPVAVLALLPGVQAVYRVTLHVAAVRACPVVATLVQRRLDDVMLALHFEGALAHKPLTYRVAPARLTAFSLALRRAGFDHLPDAPALPAPDTADLWLVERAAGTFHHHVVIAPADAEGAYSQVVEAVSTYLPEVMRRLEP